MDSFSIVVVILLGLALAVFAISLFVAIIFNVKIGLKYREPLARKLHALRLSKMLSALGISTDEYLHTENIIKINEQMERCAECGNTEECDDNLANDNMDVDRIDFCNNESTLKDMVSKKSAAE
ncbi:MAG TPA: hypothetical protein ENI64_11495 [Gammaproteobacteria bacterium]|nr:hypothetical protein [Gammaproteobacteria bacterium]